MALDGVIFDLDGTLIDTNGPHIVAWEKAFEQHGFRVFRDRIALEVGKGGDQLVGTVLGPQADAEHGDALRKAHTDEYIRMAGEKQFGILPHARELLHELKRRGFQIALASSSKQEELDAALKSARIEDIKDLFDVMTNASDAKASKPAPDLVNAAVGKLGLSPAQCAMIGDTIYDAEACRKAGVALLGVNTGPAEMPPETLLNAGARAVYRDLGDLHAHLDDALGRASPASVHLSREKLDELMQAAFDAGREGQDKGEAPAGCVLANGAGEIIARAHSLTRAEGTVTAQPEVMALMNAAGRFDAGAGDLILACTHTPSAIGLGAAVTANIDTLVCAIDPAIDDIDASTLFAFRSAGRMPRIVCLGGEWGRRSREVRDASFNQAAQQPVRAGVTSSTK
jgi:HAD superfamily hydrolase (TIGR01509 family)